MILRRLTKHVKDQNWFAVVLDFLIVVAGILIAFQITNWSAARQDNLIYQQARTRVIEEAIANLVMSQDVIQRAGDTQNTAIEIIRNLEACRAEDGAKEHLVDAIQPLRFVWGLKVRDDAINQILKSDAFLDNISPQDRTTLSAYAREIDATAAMSRFSDEFQLNRAAIQDNPIFKRTVDQNFGARLAGIDLKVSYEQACQDAALNSFLFERLENVTYIMSLAHNLGEASREVLVGLGESPPDGLGQEDAP